MITKTLFYRLFFTPSLLLKNNHKYNFKFNNHTGLFVWKYMPMKSCQWLRPYYSSEIIIATPSKISYTETLQLHSDLSVVLHQKFKNGLKIREFPDELIKSLVDQRNNLN
uniref:Uncharacterized protein n=1 Tax=viral metagenome TaxID=1070528 RepID=A0A6C0KDF6_9ZZZZ